MARRSRNLAGLAALGALGVMASRGLYKKPGEELAPVEYRGTDRPPEMPRASVESRPSTVRGDMSAADLYADAAAREALASPDEDFPRAGRTLAAPVRNQPQETFMGFDYTGPYADTGGEGRVDVAARDQSKTGPVVPEKVITRGFAPAPAPAPARPPATTARPPAAAPAARAPATQARAPASNVARGTNRAATVGPRSTGRGGATAQELVAARRGREANTPRFKEGGAVKASPKKMASVGVSSASKRADGIAQRGKTRGKVY